MAIWFKDAETDPLKIKAMRGDFQEVFTRSETGIKVLTKLLSDSYFFREARTEEEVELNNHAKKILYNAGIWVPGNELEIVRSLIKVGVVNDNTEQDFSFPER